MYPTAIASRRQFFGRSLLWGSTPWWVGAGWAQTAAALQGFVDSPSVLAGQRLTLRLRDPLAAVGSARSVPLRWLRVGFSDQVLAVDQALAWGEAMPDRAWEVGCNAWRSAYQVRVPADLASGLYYAELGSGASFARVPVVVRPAQPTPGVRILVQVPVTTVQAYNPFGGRSLYEYNSSGGQRAVQVSMQRPLTDPYSRAFDRWCLPFVRWLAREGIAADFCTSVDLHHEPALLRPYALFVTVGHDEYWTRAMRDQVDAFVALGGNLAVFSGDTCSFQMRFEGLRDDLRIVCWKDVAADPGGTLATKTGEWADLTTPHPQASTFGLSWDAGATWTSGLPRPPTPYLVQRPEHWVFAGTGLASGSAFGGGLIGYETDGAEARMAADGRLHPIGSHGTPGALRILAQADCSDWDARSRAAGGGGEQSGVASLAIFSRGGPQGSVFHAGITDWAYGLQAELDAQVNTVMGTVTRNVLRRLSARHAEPAEVRQWRWPDATAAWRSFHTLGTEVPSGAVLHGTAFAAWPLAGADTVPIRQYRLDGTGPTRWALGTEADAARFAGYRVESVLCHAWASPVPGSRPVYRWRGWTAGGQRVFTFNASPTPPGAYWSYDGTAFHVPA